jgi:hypothetical protein
VGGLVTLNVTYTPSNTTQRDLTWSSDDAGVAVVSNGTVHAVGAGTTTITAESTVNSGIRATATFNVTVGGDTILFFTSIQGLAAYLAGEPQNTAATPYSVLLRGINLETDLADQQDPLGLLYTALKGKYVNLDLRGCTGKNTQTGTTTYTEVQNRVNKDKIVSVVLPQSLTTLGDFVFYDCTSLVSVTLPDNLKIIGDQAFAQCSSLLSITLPNTLEEIGGFAFDECPSLLSLNIPASVTTIESWAFFGSTSLIFDVASGNTVFSTLDGGKMLIKNGNELISYPSATGSTTIPATITKLSFGGVFRSCTSLTSVEFSATNLAEIGYGAFWGCTALSTLIIRAPSPPVLEENVFLNASSCFSIYVPDASVNGYKTATAPNSYDDAWENYAAQIKGISTLLP